jgi:hypothetical protein
VTRVADMAGHLMVLGAALTLVGFWAVSLSASDAVAAQYQMCAGAGPPLTSKVRYARSPALLPPSLHRRR